MWFHEMKICAELAGTLTVSGVGRRTKNNYARWPVERIAGEPFKDLKTIHTWHFKIEQEKFGASAGWEVLQLLDGFLTVACKCEREIVNAFTESAGNEKPVVLVIFGNKDINCFGHHRTHSGHISMDK
jgi:hypothetical protein